LLLVLGGEWVKTAIADQPWCTQRFAHLSLVGVSTGTVADEPPVTTTTTTVPEGPLTVLGAAALCTAAISALLGRA
jgi:hypothetical protein